MFRITYKNSEYIYREFYKYHLFRRPHVFAFWVILMGAYFMSLATGKDRWDMVSFFPVFMFMQIYLYRSKVKLSYKKSCDLDGEAYTYSFDVCEDRITFSSTEGISYDIDYARIRSYAVSGNIIILYTHSGKFYILPEESFTEGEYKDLITFLNMKGIKCENMRK